MKYLNFIFVWLIFAALGQAQTVSNSGNNTESTNSAGQHLISENGMVQADGINSNGGDIINKGVFYISSEAPSVQIQGHFKNDGTIHMGSGNLSSSSIYVNDSLVNSDSGVIRIKGKNIDTSSDGHFRNYGVVHKSGDFENYVNTDASNSGTFEISKGSLDIRTDFVNEESGVIKGGKIKFSTSLTNHGTVNPGLEVGKMTVMNFFTMQNGLLEFDLNGTTPEVEYDLLDFMGFNDVSLDGDIKVNLGFAPEIGQSFTVFRMAYSKFSTPMYGGLPETVSTLYEGKIYKFKVAQMPKRVILELGAILETSYDITTAANPAEGGTTTGDGTYETGTTATVSAIPNPEYTFIKWTENDVTVSTNSEFSFNVAEDRNLTAWFEPDGGGKPHYPVEASPEFAFEGSVGGAGLYEEGETATLFAAPQNGYTFKEWTENGITVSTDKYYEFTVNEKRNLKAVFVKSDSMDDTGKLVNLKDEMQIYPNPFDDYLMVRTNGGQLHKAEFYDPTGRFIASYNFAEEGDYKVNTRQLSKGIYIMKVYTDEGIKTFKVIKR